MVPPPLDSCLLGFCRRVVRGFSSTFPECHCPLPSQVFSVVSSDRGKTSRRMEGDELELPGGPAYLHTHGLRRKTRFVLGRETPHTHRQTNPEDILVVRPVFPPLPHSFLLVWSSLCPGLRISGMWNPGALSSSPLPSPSGATQLPSTINPASAVSLLPPLLSLVTVPALCHALITPALEKCRSLGIVCLPLASSLPTQHRLSLGRDLM